MGRNVLNLRGWEMKIHKNIGDIDLMIRVIVLAVVVCLGYVVSAWFYLFAIWELFIVMTRWCPVYDLFKVDTL